MRKRIDFLVSLLAAFAFLLLTACSSTTPSPVPETARSENSQSDDAQVKAIQDIRPILGLPELPLEYVEETSMVNSPDGSWKVAMYKDGEGRKYFVETATNRVVEIDGRDLLPGHGTPVAGGMTEEELRTRAEKIARAAFPDFSSLQPKLTYEEGQKGDNAFFTWRDNYSPESFNRPFLQLAFLKNGQLFAYYNTLSSK